MGIFPKIKGLAELEKKGKWSNALSLLYNMWKEDRDNLGLLLRVGTECWYRLTYWDHDCDYKRVSFNWAEFTQPLHEVTKYGLERFGKCSAFLWIFGYMIKVFPYYFSEESDEYTFLEQKGIDMIKLAYSIEPDNRLIEILINRYVENEDDPDATESNIKSDIDYAFDGNTVIEEYFRNIFT